MLYFEQAQAAGRPAERPRQVKEWDRTRRNGEMWAIAFWHHEGRTPTHGYAATREAAMAAFAKSWRRE
jgi:hypothetical protein